MQLEWDTQKNQLLKEQRGISFEDVELALIENRILAELAHPNQEKFAHQRMIVFEFNYYAYVVPYVRKDDNTFFLKTIYPSRTMTKRYVRCKK